MLFQFNHHFIIYHLLALQRQTHFKFKLCLVFAVALFFSFLFLGGVGGGWLLLFLQFLINLFLMKLKYKQENLRFGYCLIFISLYTCVMY